MTPLGGGVQMRPTEAVNPTNLLEDKDAKVQEARTAIDLSKLRRPMVVGLVCCSWTVDSCEFLVVSDHSTIHYPLSTNN